VVPILEFGKCALRHAALAVVGAAATLILFHGAIAETQDSVAGAAPTLISHDAAADAQDGGAAAHCAALRLVDFSRVVDAPTRVDVVELVGASAASPAYCKVQGYIASNVGFELQLPIANWNGKFFEVGCGGFCGRGNEEFFYCPLHRGYACIATDLGHQGDGDGGEWGYNNLQAQIDFGYRGTHVTALAGKAITESFYGKAPSKSYFQGCSSGGQQALSEAQRFPWDFDGILTGAPAPTMTWTILYAWAKRAMIAPDGKRLFTHTDLEFLQSAAIAKCAVADGVKHGFIEDPRACKFDPAVLLCRAGQSAQCLTESQIQAVKKMYAGPTNSKGERIYPGGPLPGSESRWDRYVDTDWAENYFSYLGFWPAPGPGWKVDDFDFDRDYKRMMLSEPIMGAANNPDLRKFKAAGGKMIMYQGWADQSDIPADTIDYYETTEKTMGGGAATQEFFRLFMVPGMYHCGGGPGPAAIDYLHYLEAWVERGQAPDVMIGAHIQGMSWLDSMKLKFPLDPHTPISFSRPIYPYPLLAKYKGKGDADAAANFVPVAPSH
jgi:hypothetical protein